MTRRLLLPVLLLATGAWGAIYSPDDSPWNRPDSLGFTLNGRDIWDKGLPESFVYQWGRRYNLEHNPYLDSIMPDRPLKTFSVVVAGRMGAVKEAANTPREAAKQAVDFCKWYYHDTTFVLAVFEVIELRCPRESWR